MPLQNRVTPLGDLVTDSARGLVYGNRGCLHDDRGRIRRRFNGKRWIACQIQFRGWQRGPLMQPGQFTELFFLDEATALAAGHRPCALCRREDYTRFTARWGDLHPGRHGADGIDAQLHGERVAVERGGQLHHTAALDGLPDGAFILDHGEPWLVLDRHLLQWTLGGYRTRRNRPTHQEAVVITPPSLVALLRQGWPSLVPLIHPSAFSVGVPGKAEFSAAAAE